MVMSDSIKNISTALLKAQKEMSGASKGAKNPFYKSTYADYSAVLEACKEPLNNAGIVVTQTMYTNHLGVTVVATQLSHAESGEFMRSDTPVVVPESKKHDPQAHGSAISYARRYGLQAMVALPTVDDDGEKAMDRGTTKTETNVIKPASFKKPKVENSTNESEW